MSELPSGWNETPLDTVVDILDSRRIPLNSDEREQRIAGKADHQLFPYYGATGQVGVIDDYLFDGDYILLGEDGVPFFDPLRHKAYRAHGKFWVNNHAHVLQAINGISDYRFIEKFLNIFDYKGYVSGSTRLKLTQASMRLMPVRLAPYNEQKRIADKLDAVLARVDACRVRLDRIPTILKRFRQSILAAATSGKLTEDWRAEQTIASHSSEWQTGTLANLLVGKPRNGYSPRAVEYPTSVKSLTLTATTSGRFKGEHFKYIDEEIPLDSHLWLHPGDILIQRANTLESVGISAVYDGPPSTFIYPDLMMKAKANDLVETKFLHYLLLSEPVRRHFRDNATGTAGNMPKINQPTVLSAPATWPTREEQTEIVRRVESLFAYADRLEARYTAARTQVEKLTPATLAKAFRGELVPQDPNDEPASELLVRIKAQRSDRAETNPRAAAG